MTSKRALVVDDSRSARLVLRRLLVEYGIEVDEVDSAEAALEHLLYHKPHAIFMDHMMPGMDGLQAVRIIKSNPETALIPIMMYTSKEGGEVYLGQARALGAVGVLPKEVKSADLAAVLESLHLIGQPDIEPASHEEPEEPISHASREIEALARDAADEAMLRILKPQLDEYARRMQTGFRAELRSLVDDIQPPPPAARPPQRWPAVVGGVVLGAVLTLGIHSLLRTDGVNATVTEVAQGAGQVEEASGGNKMLRALAQQRSRADREKESLLRAVEWSLNRSGQFAPGEIPFDDRRVSFANDLVQYLHGAGFQGAIHMTPYGGEFCLAQDDNGSFTLAPDDLPALECELFGSDAAMATRGGALETVAFANYANRTPLIEGSRIRLVVHPRNDSAPQIPYPEVDRYLTAGEWNAVAQQNQRIEVRLVP